MFCLFYTSVTRGVDFFTVPNTYVSYSNGILKITKCISKHCLMKLNFCFSHKYGLHEVWKANTNDVNQNIKLSLDGIHIVTGVIISGKAATHLTRL